MKRYVVASTKAWNLQAFMEARNDLPGRWLTVTDVRDLTVDLIRTIQPRYVFFMHWSARVPTDLLRMAECVCFHMTDVPFGRGGSPLQNLISRGYAETKLTALRMTEEVDAGPVYRKMPLKLEGSARDIFREAAARSIELMRLIVSEEPQPVEQVGEPVFFQRRKPSQSVLPSGGTLQQLYDHIRMLDADTYPKAFLDHGEFRLELGDAVLNTKDGDIHASVRITRGSTGFGDKS